MFEISSPPVRAVIVTPHVMSVPAFVMKSFEPLTTQEPSRSSAVVRVAPASEPAACREVGEPLLLLLVRAVEEDRHRPERGVSGDGDRDGRVDPCELLDRDRVRHGVSSGSSVLLRDGKAHESQLAELRDELVREAAVQIELRRDRSDALPRERPDRVANQLLLGSEVEVHAAQSLAAR
jgi:hypothetical protein